MEIDLNDDMIGHHLISLLCRYLLRTEIQINDQERIGVNNLTTTSISATI